MRAAQNTEYGTPDVLRIAELAPPAIGPHQVLVAVHASVVTQGDRRLRAADLPGIAGALGRPFVGLLRPRHTVGGTNFAGRVVAVGDQVTRFSIGDDVFGSAMHGTWAEQLAIGEGEAIALMPEDLSYAEAAALPYGGVTALVFLRDMAAVKPGERVLVIGATGGVGRMAVQIAKHLGAEVTAVAGADGDLARALGADDVVDYHAEDVTARGERWDVVFDTTEGDHFRAYRSSLSATGRYLSLFFTIRLLWEMITTSFGGPRARGGVALGNASLLDDLRTLAEAGALRPSIAKRFSLDQIAAAHRYLEEARPHGDVVVDLRASAQVDVGHAPAA